MKTIPKMKTTLQKRRRKDEDDPAKQYSCLQFFKNQYFSAQPQSDYLSRIAIWEKFTPFM